MCFVAFLLPCQLDEYVLALATLAACKAHNGGGISAAAEREFSVKLHIDPLQITGTLGAIDLVWISVQRLTDAVAAIRPSGNGSGSATPS